MSFSRMRRFAAAVALTAIGLLIPSAEGGCSLYCAKDAEPVCAHSPTRGYKDFSDKCALEQANDCEQEDWNLIHSGPCSSTEIAGCSLDCNPVCGYSRTLGFKSFLNKDYCIIAAELYDYFISHEGECTSTEVPSTVCPGACTKEYVPVCGYSPASGFQTFSNKCQLELENKCSYGYYSLIRNGACTNTELEVNCQRSCTQEYQPVCGLSSDKGYSTFNNLCVFYLQNGCPQYDSDYTLIHPGACTTDEIASHCQPGFCQDVDSPVCASSLPFYRTFPNKCLYYVENSCKYGDFQLVHTGECMQNETAQSCNFRCSTARVPTCGYSSTRGYRTFLNRCFINYENACFGADYGAIRLGECTKEELGLICGLEFCLESPAKTVCGLSPTKGYTSFSSACLLYAENTCRDGDYKLAHVGDCTKKERGIICLPEFCLSPSPPVCASSASTGYYTFPNRCFFNAENTCKSPSFTFVHEGKCTTYEVGGKCPVTCGQECQYLCSLSPTLGYRTFLNKCTFEAENGCNGGDYVFNHRGECTKSELERNCQLQCTYDYKPVCALSPTKGYYSFPNKCSYILEVSCYGGDYKFQYGGVCDSSEVTPAPNCEEGLCPTGYSPVCGYSKSNNVFQTFSTKCLFDTDNKCKFNYDFIFSHYGACSQDELDNNCQRSCGSEVSPVCGLSPTLGYNSFKNICQLLLGLSCLGKDYTLAHEGQCTAQEVPICSTTCPGKYSPVCGFSPSLKVFKTFSNKCKWEYENQCSYGDYILAHTGACSKLEIENNCKRSCPTTYAPVCGKSPTKGYKTFNNVYSYILDITCLGGDFLFSNEGKCKYPEGPQEGCPVFCTADFNPVCTYSSSTKGFKTFSNQCRWNAENQCNHGDYVYVHPGQCTKDESGKKCYRKCPFVYRPVCGVHVTNGYRTFPSQCELEVANKCDLADYSLAHLGKCTSQELGGACNHICPLYYIGICGYSPIKGHKTFANECFLDRENTCTLSDYTVAHTGKCSPEETGEQCNRVCQLVYSPICTKSATEGYKNFANFCLLDRENSCYSHDYNVVHQGECFPWELCVNCSS